MKRSQLNAISYAYAKKAREQREKFILEKEGNLKGFAQSKYKTLRGYIVSKYGVNM